MDKITTKKFNNPTLCPKWTGTNLTPVFRAGRLEEFMKLQNGWYIADNGKHFILTEKGKEECASFKHKVIGEPVDEYDTESVAWAVDSGYVIEVDIPGWTTLKGYQVVYYYNENRLFAGNKETFPTKKIAEIYKKNYESYSWMDHELCIEEVEYEGVPLSKSKIFNGKEVIDKEHYFGLNACEIGDYFTEDMIDSFMNMLPPAFQRSDCFQIGDPVSCRNDESGHGRTTYDTFKKVFDNIWEYCGDCFLGENIKRGTEMPYVK